MKIVHGDLIKLALKGDFDVIIHGANCFCTMGAGIAKSIRSEFPEAYKEDQRTIRGDRSKLGDFTWLLTSKNGHSIIVINAYTQFDFRGRGVKADYNAIRSVFKKIKFTLPGRRFGFPLIGAGLAGGDWKVISKIISEELQGEDFTLVKYS